MPDLYTAYKCICLLCNQDHSQDAVCRNGTALSGSHFMVPVSNTYSCVSSTLHDKLKGDCRKCGDGFMANNGEIVRPCKCECGFPTYLGVRLLKGQPVPFVLGFSHNYVRELRIDRRSIFKTSSLRRVPDGAKESFWLPHFFLQTELRYGGTACHRACLCA